MKIDKMNSAARGLQTVDTTTQQAVFLRIIILSMIMVLAFSIRLFSVVRYESIIHEFDPWFNFRATKHMVEHGFLSFLNWFDDRSWYPLGRNIGQTIYPGLMATASVVYHFLHALNIPVDIRNLCVLTGPIFSSFTAVVAYLMGSEVFDEGAGLVAAMFIAVNPGFLSRSVAGSYDNEAVAIFALLLTFYVWIKAVHTGRAGWAVLCAVCYCYMVAAWGGYIYIINLLPIYTLVLILSGRFSQRLYVAYSVTYVFATLMSMQVTIVEFKPVRTPEHLPAMGVFAIVQLFALNDYMMSILTPVHYKNFRKLAVSALGVLAVVGAFSSGYAFQWTGRLQSLLQGGVSSIPIISSVAEHQPAVWSTLFFDMHMTVFLTPLGIYFCFRKLSDGSIFLIIYSLTSLYFSCAMVRLILVASPAACLMAGAGVSYFLRRFTGFLKFEPSKFDMAFIATIVMTGLLWSYNTHSKYIAAEVYSSPSIVLQAGGGGGNKIIIDDFREAYRWISQNTEDEDVVMSWWDYGYQISGMANRTVLVDGNTRNNTHIARVGRAFASSEAKAHAILHEMDVNYVLVIFGGMLGYSGDDINKFLWMVKIGGGVFPDIVEQDYYGSDGNYRIGRSASTTMLNSLMYKLCYYRFGELKMDYNQPAGFDRVRGEEIGNKGFNLRYFEEAYTTEHWLVRVYRLKDPKEIK